MNDIEIELAVKELERFLVNKEWYLLTNGWAWYGSALAPEHFEELKGCGRCLPISTNNCDNTIHTTPHMNRLGRFWHDVTHINEDKDFTTANELHVVYTQYIELHKAGVSENAREVFWADIQGQVMYYRDHGKFVENQREFVLNKLRNK